MSTPALVNLHPSISTYLNKIVALFKPGAKITLIVRNPDVPDGDVILGNDNLDDAIAAINNLKAREPIFKEGDSYPDPTKP